MRIERQPDGRYIKTLTPELKRFIERFYAEVRERKRIDAEVDDRMKNSLGLVNEISAQMDLLIIKSNETMEVINALFPIGSDEVNMDKKFVIRELEVTLGAHFNSTMSVRSNATFQAHVSANSFSGTSIELEEEVSAGSLDVEGAIVGATGEFNYITLTRPTVQGPPMIVSSTGMVVNLNSQFLEGKTAADFALQANTYTKTQTDAAIAAGGGSGGIVVSPTAPDYESTSLWIDTSS